MSEQEHPESGGEHVVARQQELDRLNNLLESALSGKGQICFVAGEAGIGKSALVAEFEHQALSCHQDLVLAVGLCDPQLNGGLPYAPFRDLLAMLTHASNPRALKAHIAKENSTRLARTAKTFGDMVVKFGPDIINIFVPGVALPIKISQFAMNEAGLMDTLKRRVTGKEPKRKSLNVEELTQEQVIEQYVNVIRALTEQAPLLLVLEDLHWADSASVNLLFRLSRRLDDCRVLIIGTYRPNEAQKDHADELSALEKVLDELKRYRGDVFLDLNQSRLERGREFVDAFIDSEPNHLGKDFRDALFAHTGGQPLFTVELLRDMQAHGQIIRDGERRWVAQQNLRWDAIPARVEGVIESRIANLTNEMREMLKVASVEGEQFTAEVVAQVQSMDLRVLIHHLSGDLHITHQLVEALEVKHIGQQRLSHYRFVHQLFQRYLYGTLDTVELSTMHEAVGLALETLYGEQAETIAPQLARHFEIAEMQDKARLYLHKAGEQAAAAYANDAALDFLGRALALTAPADTQNRYAILARRERVYDLLGKRALQREDLDELARLAEVAADSKLKRAEVVLRRAKLAQNISDYETAVAQSQEAIHIVETDEPSNPAGTPLLIDAYLIWAGALTVHGDSAQAREQLARALEIARQHQDQSGECYALTALSTLHVSMGDYAAANDDLEQALRLAQANADTRQEAIILTDLGVVATYQKRFAEAEGYYRQAREIVKQIGDRHREAILVTNLGWVNLESGDYVQAREFSEQAAALAEDLGDPKVQGVALINLCEAHWQLGEFDKANAHATQALTLFRNIQYRWNEAIILADLGQIALSLGRCEQARQSAEESLKVARAIDSRQAQGTALIVLGRALAGLNQLPEAEQAFGEARTLWSELGDEPNAAAARAGLASVSLAYGGQENLDQALSQIDDLVEDLTYGPPVTLAGGVPMWVYQVCADVLRAHQDPRAGRLIAAARAELVSRANRISHAAARRTFLDQVPENQAIERLR